MKSNKGIIISFLIFLVSMGVLVFFFINCIIKYNNFDVDYNDLKCQELTYKKFVKISGIRQTPKYEIYFTEYENPFIVSTITQKGLNKKSLSELDISEKVLVYYSESFSDKYQYTICEMRNDNNIILSLKDFKKLNQNNQIIGIIICPIIVLGLIYCVWTYPRPYNRKKKKKTKSTPDRP